MSLEPRERRVLVAGAVIVLVTLLFGGVLNPLYARVAELETSVREDTDLLAWMQRTAARVQSSRGAASVATGNPVTDFTRQARAAGLQRYLQQTRPDGSTGVRAEFRNAPFDQLIELLGALEANTGMQVVEASVVPGDVAGTGDVRLTLARAGG